MAFERFTETRARNLIPKASIWSRGQIGFNKSAVIKFQIKMYNYLVLFYDSDSKRIGIKLTNRKEEEGAIKITKKLASGGASVSANSFIFHYGINASETRNYDLELDTDSGLITMDTAKYTKDEIEANLNANFLAI